MLGAGTQLMLAMPVDQDGREDTQTDTQRHAETDADFEKRGRSAGGLVYGLLLIEQLNCVEGGFCDGVVRGGVGMVEVDGRGCANGFEGCDGGRAIDCQAIYRKQCQVAFLGRLRWRRRRRRRRNNDERKRREGWSYLTLSKYTACLPRRRKKDSQTRCSM